MVNPLVSASDRQRIWFAHALRAVACINVVLAHYCLLFVSAPHLIALGCLCPPLTNLAKPSYVEPLQHWIERHQFGNGMFAVSLFFLVSGFVIPFSLKSTTLRGFFSRRFFRLYPTLWVVLAVVAIVLWYQARVHDVHNPFNTQRAILSNALLINPYLAQPFLEATCWSLVIEELFYLVCALLAWRGQLNRPTALLAAAFALAGFSIFWVQCRPAIPTTAWQRVGHNLAFNCTYAVFIFVGVVLHHMYVGAWHVSRGVPVAVAVMGLYWTSCNHGMANLAGPVPIFFYAGINALGVFLGAMLINRWLPYSRVIDWLATISYPLYLVHATLGYITIRAVYLASGSLHLGIGAALTGALLLATIVHRYVERPGIDLGKRLTRVREKETFRAEEQPRPVHNRHAA